jgi:EAL domain-containing protein (putative c-di-GMP-specific phosphodiesterase class I)
MSQVSNKNPLSGLIAGAVGSGSADGIVQRALEAIRSHLGMEVAYVSEFVDNRSVFRQVDAPGLEAVIKVGDSQSLDDVYCRHILDGRLPQLMADTSAEPLAMAMPITQAVPIGKHMSVPIRMPDGRPYGMFCCLGFAADRSLHERDLQMMKAFADLAAFEINRDLQATKLAEEKRARLNDVIEQRQLSIVYQPIWNVESGRPIGVECLARFSATPLRSPDKWFNEAAEAGVGTMLELAAIRMALSAFASFPADAYLAVNASAETILSDDLPDALSAMPGERIVLELTEHSHVEDYNRLRAVLAPLRQNGVRIAVDDAGAGYSSLRHILHLQPELIKLDMGLTRSIDIDQARRALAGALIGFARDTGSTIIAEGVETASELATLRQLGANCAQGYFLGRPMSLARAAALFNRDAVPSAQVA